jgi:hypothetical protein
VSRVEASQDLVTDSVRFAHPLVPLIPGAVNSSKRGLDRLSHPLGPPKPGAVNSSKRGLDRVSMLLPRCSNAAGAAITTEAKRTETRLARVTFMMACVLE